MIAADNRPQLVAAKMHDKRCTSRGAATWWVSS